ncbi:MAG: hypothetical protein K8U03_15515 [Planctomycetia bacterium]|nr:hypothetical protein [Planctomycetia bacterium]
MCADALAVARDRTTFRFVLATWLLSTAFALWFAVGLGFRIPYADEWRWAGEVTGQQSEGTAWFLKSENSHRLPLPKLIYIGLTQSTGDFRSTAVASVLLLSASSLVLIFCMRRRRGSTSPLDILFPLLVLHGGNYLNLMWGLQIFYCLSTALATLWLGLVIASGPRLSLRAAVAAGALLLALGFCGGPGICLLPALALWLVYAGVERWRDPDSHSRRDAVVIIAQVVPAGLLVVWYFSGSAGVGFETESVRVIDALRGAAQAVTISCGRMGRELWPVSGFIVFGGLVAVSCFLVRSWLRRPEVRLEVVGMACFLLAMVAQALAIGIARGALSPDYCLTGRYTLLTAPLLAACAVCAGLYATRSVGLRAQWVMTVVVLAVAISYGSNGVHHARELLVKTERVERLVQEGVSPRVIGDRCSAEMQDWARSLEMHLTWLQAAGLPPYERHPAASPAEFTAVHKLADVASGKIQRTVVDGRVRLEIPLRIPQDHRVALITVRTKNNLRSRKRINGFDWSLTSQGVAPAGKSWSQKSDVGDPLFATLQVPVSEVASSTSGMSLVLQASEPGIDFPADTDRSDMIDAYLYFSPAPITQAEAKQSITK